MSKYVYIAKCRENRIKIGISDNPEARIQQLQTGNPDRIRLIRAYESDTPEETEKRLHDSLGSDRLMGEWFNCSDERVGTMMFLFNSVGVDHAAEWISREEHVLFNIMIALISSVNNVEAAMMPQGDEDDE